MFLWYNLPNYCGYGKKIIGILVDIFFVIVFMLEIIEIYWWYINVENNGNYLLKILSTEICLKWLFYIRDCWELIKLGYKLCFDDIKINCKFYMMFVMIKVKKFVVWIVGNYEI